MQAFRSTGLPPLPRGTLELKVLPLSKTSVWTARSIWCQFISNIVTFFNPEMFQERYHYVNATDKFALLIDDRLTLANWWSIPWSLHMLGPEWGLQIFARKNNIHVFEGIVREYKLANVYIDTLQSKYGLNESLPAHWIHDVHFMLTKQFWMGLRGEHILILQDHGVPVRRWNTVASQVILKNIFEYAYAGAPWSFVERKHDSNSSKIDPTNLKAIRQDAHGLWKADGGGNGGFSYRKRSWMMAFGIDSSSSVEDLLNSSVESFNYLGHENEDWLWGRILSAHRHGVAPTRLECQFAAETLMECDGVLGVHNYATYHSVQDTVHLVQSAAKEFFQVETPIFRVRLTTERVARQSPWLNSWRHLKYYSELSAPMECTVPEGNWASPLRKLSMRIFGSLAW